MPCDDRFPDRRSKIHHCLGVLPLSILQADETHGGKKARTDIWDYQGILNEQQKTELREPGNKPARTPAQRMRSREGNRPIRRCLLFLLAALFAWTVGEPATANAQFAPTSDPVCRFDGLYDGSVTTGKFEYDVKAALLYRCLELVEWPANASSSGTSALTVGILGKNPFGESLDCLRGKTIAGRKLVVTKLSRVTHASRCQLLFISASETNRTSKILDGLAPLPVLTVGEIPGFTEQGGIINLLLEGNNIRLEINQAAAEKAHLQIDPNLIKLAALMARQASAGNTSPVSLGEAKQP